MERDPYREVECHTVNISEMFQERAYPSLLEFIQNTDIGLLERQKEVRNKEALDRWDMQLLSHP